MASSYTHRHDGPALVIGYGPSVYADVEAARRLRPDAAMLGVKYACVLFPEIEHVWTQHLEQAPHIRAKARRSVFIHSRNRVNQTRKSFSWVAGHEKDIDFVWPELKWVYGSSGFAAALWARHGMGFGEVIMCGIGLEPGRYAQGVEFKNPAGDYGQSFVDTPVLMRWRDVIMEFVRDGKTAGVTSMSGWTRERLGAPC